MIQIKKSFFLVFFISLFTSVSCKNTEGSSNEPLKEEDAKDCFENMQSNFENYLDPKKLIELGISIPEGIQPRVQKDDKNTNGNRIVYVWKSDRSKALVPGENGMTIPQDNMVGYGLIRKSDDAPSAALLFNSTYGPKSEEELKGIRTNISQSIESEAHAIKLGSEDVAKWVEAELSKFQYNEVTGIGDKAFWDEGNSALHILNGAYRWSVFVNLSEDQQSNIEQAKKLAQKLISQCN